LDNTPHVPFIIPIIRELERHGYQIVLTARDAFQVCELAEEKGLKFVKIGRHYGRNMLIKAFGLFWRAAQLLPFFLRERPSFALSHGSRSQVFLCNILGIPSIVMMDYEHSRTITAVHPKWEIVPEALYTEKLHAAKARVKHYRGIKEDVYVPDFKPDQAFLEGLNLDKSDFIITVRPPANEAHYRNPESEQLLVELMARICQTENVKVVMLPRNPSQGKALRTLHNEWFVNEKTIIPNRVVDGLNLLWFSDLVVSGGGTMNREASALGVPVYSIFRGPMGAVDRMLEKEGRLVMIRNIDEVWTKIVFIRRDKSVQSDSRPRTALSDIVKSIEDIIQIEENPS
jgi:uncharacterized protein